MYGLSQASVRCAENLTSEAKISKRTEPEGSIREDEIFIRLTTVNFLFAPLQEAWDRPYTTGSTATLIGLVAVNLNRRESVLKEGAVGLMLECRWYGLVQRL